MTEGNDSSAAEPGERPLSGVRILAFEQMAALPFATQLLARLGADVVKIEHPTHGDSGRAATPWIEDPEGRKVGATFLRSNLGKRSVAIDTKHPAGAELVMDLIGRFDVFVENFKPGALDRMGLGYEAVSQRWPQVVYASLSGFGNTEGPYRTNPAYASVVEAMSGIYEFKRTDTIPPRANPVGALGDISSGLFTVIGVLAALRDRDRTGLGQHVDVAMYDSTIAMTDIVMNFWSLGINDETEAGTGVIDTFAAADGHFVLQVVREHHFEILARTIGHPEWLDDPRLSTRAGWAAHVDSVLRPDIESWAASRTKREAAAELAAAGLACGPSHTSEDLVNDEQVRLRNMAVEMQRPDGGPPVLVPGLPCKLSSHPEPTDGRVPWLGEHTDAVLNSELGLSPTELQRLRDQGVIA